jgi:rod shape-determining protein MreD
VGFIRKLRLALCAVSLLLVDVAFAYRLSYGILRADLVLALAAFLALEAGAPGVVWSAVALGVLRDMASSARPGGSVVGMLAAAGLALALRDRVYREKVLADMMLAFLFVLSCGVVRGTGTALFSPARWGAMMGHALGQALLTAALCPLLFPVFRRLGLVQKEEHVLA